MHHVLLRSALAILLFVAAPAQAQTSANSAPIIAPPDSWVMPLPPAETSIKAGKTTAAPATGLPATLISLDMQARFTADGSARYAASSVRIETPQGLAALGNVSIPWSPDTSSLTVHRLAIRRGAETIDILANGQTFTVLRRENNLEAAMLDGVLTATIQPEGLQVGDILDFAVTITTRDPVLKDHNELFLGPIVAGPTTRLTLRASWADNRPVRWRKSATLPDLRLTKAKGETILSLDVTGLPEIAYPKGAPGRFNPVRFVEFSDFAQWGDIAALMAPLYTKAATIPSGSPLAAEVEKIRAAHSDPVGRAGAALKLVQDRVRYVYQGMNSGNLVPADAATSWGRRFADCKGKTALLLAMLHALEIDAEPALVSTNLGDGLDARLPLVGLFDHILVRVQIAGKTYWMDGTRNGDRGLESLAVPPFQWALPVREGNSRLERLDQVPLSEPTEHTEIRVNATRGIDLPAPFEVDHIVRGDQAVALKAQLDTIAPSEREKTLKAYWTKQYSFVTPELVDWTFDTATGVLKLTMDGTADLDWTSSGYELDGAGLGWSGSDYARESGYAADAPVKLSFPQYTSTRETIRLPWNGRGFTVTDADIDKTVGGFAFRRKVGIVDGAVVMEASSRSLQPEIPLAEALIAAKEWEAMSKVRLFVNTAGHYTRTPEETAAMIARKPETAQDFFRRGNLFLDQGDYPAAVADFSAVLEKAPDDNNALAHRGMSLAMDGKLDAAQADLDKAGAKDTSNFVVQHGRAALSARRGDLPSAVAALSRAIDLRKDNRYALFQRSSAYALLGETEKALADVDQLLTLSPGAGDSISRKITILSWAGRPDEALAFMDTQRKADPDNVALRINHAMLLASSGRTAEARDAFAALRVKAGDKADERNSLCWAAALAGFDLDQADADCAAAIKAAPDSMAIADSHAYVALRQGNNALAISRYSAVLAKQPRLAPSLYGLGLAKMRNGDTVGGAADLAAARMIDPYVALTFLEKPEMP